MTIYTNEIKTYLKYGLHLMSDHPITQELFSKGINQRMIGKGLGFIGGFLIGWPIGQVIGKSRRGPNWTMALAGLGAITIGYSVEVNGIKKCKRLLIFTMYQV